MICRLALSTFAFSFLVRPLGGLFWGPLGDRLGRKRILALTIIPLLSEQFLPAADAGSVSSASRRLRMGSSAVTAAPGSRITSTSMARR